MDTLLKCSVHITVQSENSCILLLQSYSTSLNKLPILSSPFLCALKWKKIEGKEFETHFEYNLKQKIIPRSALSSYPMTVDLVLSKSESKLYTVWPVFLLTL